jgi:hypothetical protein
MISSSCVVGIRWHFLRSHATIRAIVEIAETGISYVVISDLRQEL